MNRFASAALLLCALCEASAQRVGFGWIAGAGGAWETRAALTYPRSGLKAGIAFEAAANDFVALVAEATYTAMRDENVRRDARVDYVELPVSIKVARPFRPATPFVRVGVVPSRRVFCREGTAEFNVPETVRLLSDFRINGPWRPSECERRRFGQDVALLGGVGLGFSGLRSQTSLEARYSQGTQNMNLASARVVRNHTFTIVVKHTVFDR